MSQRRLFGFAGSVLVGLGLVDTFAYDKTIQRNIRTLINGVKYSTVDNGLVPFLVYHSSLFLN